MMDVTRFGIVRSPRRAEPVQPVHAALDTPLGRDLVALVRENPRPGQDLNDMLQQFFEGHRDPLPLAAGIGDPNGTTEFLIVRLGDLDRWLATRTDRPAAADLEKEWQRIQGLYKAQ